jgi:hypothetical protein
LGRKRLAQLKTGQLGPEEVSSAQDRSAWAGRG